MPPRAARQAPRAVGVGRPLKLESQNVCGMRDRGKLAGLVKGWVSRGSDVVCLQETHIGFWDGTHYANLLNTECRRTDPQHHGFQVLWGFNNSGNCNHSAGVAILLKRALLTSGELAFRSEDQKSTGDGRFLSLKVNWLGERFNLVCAHLPCAQTTQVQQIYSRLAPLAGEPGFWGGDWNFVANTALDRLSVHMPAPLAQVHGDAAGAAGGEQPDGAGPQQAAAPQAYYGPAIPRPERAFVAVAPDMVDCFRVMHPQRRCFTWHGVGLHRGQASRLDRWFCSSRFSAYLLHCDAQSPSLSDHRPVVVEVLPLRPSTSGKGYRRARPQQFWQDEGARQQFQTFAAALAAEAPDPTDHQQALALLQWWPGAKQRLLKECGRLAWQCKAAGLAQADAEDAQAAAELQAAYAAVEIMSSPARLAGSIQRVIRARQAWRELHNEAQAQSEWRARRDWVHSREHPSKGLTDALAAQQPPTSRLIPGLCSPATGRVVTHGRPLAQLMATYQANISKASPRDPVAVQAVVAVVAASPYKLTAEQAQMLGGEEVEETEVRDALKHSKPGTAPGLDGLPVELYRKCADIFVPLLATIFTAMGKTSSIPQGLLDGVISCIYKKGARADPANYRPITVLGTDYRVLAKVLVNRLKPFIGQLVHPGQTGFVPGRHIGENLLLSQLLPAALGPDSQAGVVCCDFRKAYDTVDRGFLFAVMEAQGVPSGYMKWVKLLLSDTSARACINGHLSGLVSFTAGVRQGCPLAPYLYLFVTQALFCFLASKGFGVEVAGKTLVAGMYADDTHALLRNMFTDLAAFKSAMATFEHASNQALAVVKSFLLPIGRGARRKLWTDHYMSVVWQRRGPLAPQAEVEREATELARQALIEDKASVPTDLQLHGFPVASQVTSLGVLLRADGSVSADWPGLLAKVQKAYTFISKLHLSNFGRGFASAGYGMSKILYAAEFVGLPPADVLAELDRITAKLVDKGMSPDARGRAFTGVRGELLAGHPSTGGFGAMPWKQHILARHAVWATRMMLGSSATPWIHVARRLLCPLDSTCAAWQRLGIAMCTQRGKGPSGEHINHCLDRLAGGMRALPTWRACAHGPSLSLVPGPWCASMPLWCNPFLLTTGASGPLPANGLEVEFADLARIPTFCSLKDALSALAELRGGTLGVDAYRRFRQWWLGNNPLFISQEHAQDRLSALVAAIPACWKDAVDLHALGALPSSEEVVTSKLLPRICWYRPRSTVPVPLAKMKVKQATQLQLGPLLASRAAKQMSFLEEACVSLPLDHNISPDNMPPLYKRLWELPWDNSKKVVFWLLSLNGLPTAERLHQEGESCACGVQVPGRAHHFWDCPVATAVREEIEKGLNNGGGHYSLLRHHVWLCMRPPWPGLHVGVWQVVCLSALLAMHRGMKLLTHWRLHGNGAARQRDQRPPPPVAQRVAAASRVAKASFWDHVQDFLGLGLAPVTWCAEVPVGHPFIQLHQPAADGRSLRLHKV